MKVYEIIETLENIAPLAYQESYDNSGLAIGNKNGDVNGALCTLDVTNEVLDEAIEHNCNLIISHHPLIFSPLKSITGKNKVEKIVAKAIKNDISIYSGHTNFDNIRRGVNNKICEKLELKDCSILAPLGEKLVKLVTFVPTEHAEKVRNALFLAGAGHIGNYDSCSYNLEGYGTFRGDENSNPFVGNQGDLHTEKETRIETIVPRPILRKVVQSMKTFHPYEEVAYDIYPLDNTLETSGAGMIGQLDNTLTTKEFLELCKTVFKCQGISYTGHKESITKVAVCGGSGSFLIGKAASSKADAFITGDIKYHQFLDANKNMLLIDVGHFESEQFTPEIFYDIITEKFPTFAVRLSRINTNPVKLYT